MEPPPGEGEPQGLVFVVTGGGGFLGSHLARLLLEEEPELRELRLFDLRPSPPPGLTHDQEKRLRLVQGDVGAAGAVGRALAGAQVVFHAASLVDVWGRATPEAIARVNVQGTKTVLRGCREGGVRCLIYTSSMEVVGPNTRGDPFLRGDEDTPYPVRHTEPYPLSKAQAERLVLEANGSPVAGGGRLVTAALRPTGIYGEGHELLAEFYRRGRAVGGWLPRTLPPHAEHGRVYVGNVAWMHILAARAGLLSPSPIGGEVFFCYDDSPPAGYEEFNQLLLAPAGFRLRGPLPPAPLVGLVAKINGFLRRVLKPPLRPSPYAPLLNPYTWAVASTPFTVRTDKARRVFGYRPLFSWQEARDRTLSWVLELPRS